MTSINTILNRQRVNCSRGAPMGDCGFIHDEQPFTRMRCERLRMVDGDYGPDGTYWGYSPSHGRMYVIFNGENEKFEPAGGLLKYYRAKNRADAIAQFQAEYPGYKFTRGAL